MKTQYQQFLEFSEYPTFKEYLQHQVDTMRIDQESADIMLSTEEHLNKFDLWDLFDKV